MCKRVKFWVYLLIIAALASAGISPACAFVSGKTSLIEICAADGSLKTIAVDENQNPIDPAQHSHKAQKDCAFCFSNAHSPASLAKAPMITAPLRTAYLEIGSGSAIPITRTNKAFESTGPPIHS